MMQPKTPGQIYCSNCGRPYPEGTPYACPLCTGVYEFWEGLPGFDPARIEENQPGIWRYRHTFGLPPGAPVISLSEGRTPFHWVEGFGRRVALKLESENPSGSHKDRGVAVMTAFLKARGVRAAVEDSSGNAGASFALYARAAGIQARIYIPDYASGPKRNQIEAYGAEVFPISGGRQAVTDAVRKAAAEGDVYASHAYMPFMEPGYATLAYELVEDLGSAPGTVIVPAGQGGLLLGLASGFENLRRAGLIPSLPRLVGVQAIKCAPLWAVSTMGRAGLQWVSEGETLAEGVRVVFPVRGDRLLQAVESSGGAFLAVEEDAILPGRDELARRGFKVEPTSALVWDALAQLSASQLPEPVVLVLTGAGYKSNLPFNA